MEPTIIANLLGVKEDFLTDLDRVMSEKTGRFGILQKIEEERALTVELTLKKLKLEKGTKPEIIRQALIEKTIKDEKDLLKFINIPVVQTGEFEKIANFAKKIGKPKKGFFLKKEKGEEILRKRRPDKLLEFLHLQTVDELFKQYNVTEAFSALRFIETDAWMHETFAEAYGHFTPRDFEEREIAIEVLGPQWMDVATKFVAKKHHNVSHLKEFGVIFLNPIREDAPGKFLRDFALLLHYYNEIEFYSKLFKRYSLRVDFANKFKALLRGDVRENPILEEGEWLIVQRYLFKENPADPRLFIPHLNPESLHWDKGEESLALLGQGEAELDLEFWMNSAWVGYFVGDNFKAPISFDIEDNIMSGVSRLEGKNEYLNYHQKEALWTKIFQEYCGGRANLENLLVENFDKGIIKF